MALHSAHCIGHLDCAAEVFAHKAADIIAGCGNIAGCIAVLHGTGISAHKAADSAVAVYSADRIAESHIAAGADIAHKAADKTDAGDINMGAGICYASRAENRAGYSADITAAGDAASHFQIAHGAAAANCSKQSHIVLAGRIDVDCYGMAVSVKVSGEIGYSAAVSSDWTVKCRNIDIRGKYKMAAQG